MTIVVALLVVLGVLILVYRIGSRMPREHRASRSKRIGAPPSDVFNAITDVQGFAAWRTDLKKVELLDDVNGKRRYRETSDHGPLTFEVTEAAPGKRVITTIVDEGQPFGGSWTFELRPEGAVTRVTITEDGYVSPPIFRLLSRYVFGHTANMDNYLKNLEKRFPRAYQEFNQWD
ncbi:MAG: SRPBCC domain-containing protein [Vicinamibacteria bacterium]